MCPVPAEDVNMIEGVLSFWFEQNGPEQWWALDYERRHKAGPFAEARGWSTDEDVFREVS